MDPRKLSVKELVQLCLDSQDEAVWTEFVRRFQPLIAGVVNRCVLRKGRSNPTLVDDLVQDTYLKLCANNFKALRNFEFHHDNALFAFLKVIATNVVEDYYRRIKNEKRGGGRQEVDIEEVRNIAPANPRLSQPVEREILVSQINKCLAELAAEPNFVRDYTIF